MMETALPGVIVSTDLSRRQFLGHACTGSAGIACAALFVPSGFASLPITDMDAFAGGDVAERTYPVPAADGVSIDRASAVILVRLQGRAFALGLTCPHQQASVKWLEKDKRFQCTKHDSKYQPDGTYTSGKSTRNLDRFAIRLDGPNVIVDIGRTFKADADAAGWRAAIVALPTA
jgi:nitrite reductase/ring-hydroxylating ferredoxin subunit